jgi:hypothetical protein
VAVVDGVIVVPVPDMWGDGCGTCGRPWWWRSFPYRTGSLTVDKR